MNVFRPKDSSSHQGTPKNPLDAISKFREQSVEETPMRQPIIVSRSPDTIVKEILKQHKRGSINIRKKPNVEFIGEAGMDADALTREFCHIVMSGLKEGSGGSCSFRSRR